MLKSIGYAAQNDKTPLAPLAFERQEPGEKDVQIEILYCGVVSHKLSLHDAPNAYQHFDAREDGWTKVILKPTA